MEVNGAVEALEGQNGEVAEHNEEQQIEEQRPVPELLLLGAAAAVPLIGLGVAVWSPEHAPIIVALVRRVVSAILNP